MRKKFVYRKDLAFYREIYARLCERRILLYNSIESEELLESTERAYNFLLALKIFRKSIPKKIIKERFEDFRDTRDLALCVLKE